jgi:hypothetical protein
MKHPLLLIFLFCCAKNGLGQFLFVEFEPYLGVQYDQKIRNTEVILPEKGLAYIYGVNSILNVGPYFGMKGGLGVRNEPFESTVTAQLSASITCAYFKDRTIALGVEFGMEFIDYTDFRTPLYFKIDQKIARGIRTSYRLRLPAYYDTHQIMSTRYNAYGIEIGLKFAFPNILESKPIPRHGNPFILI